MISRIFKARILPENCQAWQDRVERFSIPWLKAQRGLLAYYPGKPIGPTTSIFTMVSVWESVDAIREAVGDDWEAVVLLEDEASLVEEATVEHYEHFGN